jgi:hypothetical protein
MMKNEQTNNLKSERQNMKINTSTSMDTTNLTANNQQLELELLSKPIHRPQPRRVRRLPGARWWFSQMRLAVASATEWTAKPHTTTRPEQVDLLCPTAR